jgi:hypothetical protein
MDHSGRESGPKMKYKFKYLGMKWRFLKIELEKEALPPVPRGDQIALDNQSVLERSVIFETYEKGFNFIDHYQQQNSLVRISSSLLEDSFGSLNQFPTSELDNSVFTEEDLVRGIRNVQIFQSLEPIKPTPPSTFEHHQLGPAKPMVFSPRPPDECKPSASVGLKLPNRSPRVLKNQKVKRSVQIKAQIQKLDISKSFKMYHRLLLLLSQHFRRYALEKGIRIPECVKSVQVDRGFDGVLPSLPTLPPNYSTGGGPGTGVQSKESFSEA